MTPMLGIMASQISGHLGIPTANMKLRLDASVASSITSSGGRVSQWNDQSAAGNNFVQATAAYKPETGVATINGLNALRFNNGVTNQKMESAGAASIWAFLGNATGCTVFIAGKYANAGIEAFILGTFDGSTSIAGYACNFTTNAYLVNYNGGSSALAVNNNTGVTGGVTNPFLYTAINDPSNGTASARNKIYLNSSTAYQNNTLTNAINTGTPQTTAIICNVGISNAPYVGTIGEIIVYSGQLSGTDVSTVQTYLKTKWGTP